MITELDSLQRDTTLRKEASPLRDLQSLKTEAVEKSTDLTSGLGASSGANSVMDSADMDDGVVIEDGAGRQAGEPAPVMAAESVLESTSASLTTGSGPSSKDSGSKTPHPPQPSRQFKIKLQRSAASLSVLWAIALVGLGLVLDVNWLGLAGSGLALLFSLRLLWPTLRPWLGWLFSPDQRTRWLPWVGLTVAIAGVVRFTPLYQGLTQWLSQVEWDIVGALGDFLGAFGQIGIAILAVYVAWRQYVISKDLTQQQNLITQQQTIDAYFQGISDLVLTPEGLLEDWPQERAIAEGRTAALLSSVDAAGKAKVIRFLSRSKLLTPLRRDQHLGRAILDGSGGYEEHRASGIRVIHLRVMLAKANLAGTDLRWTDLSDANLVEANLSHCDLVQANFSRTILYNAKLVGADLRGVRFFYGPVETARPRNHTDLPDYETGAFTGAVVANVDFTGAKRMSEEQRYYCCAWGGAKTRATIPGGCQGIPNLQEGKPTDSIPNDENGYSSKEVIAPSKSTKSKSTKKSSTEL